MSMRRLAVFLFMCAILLSSVAFGEGEPFRTLRDYGGSLYNVPVYDPDSKSYFELVKIERGNYEKSRKHATTKRHKRVRGRLAIIRSQKTGDFLVKTFKPPIETWIGLRMFCHRRILFWINGEKLKRKKEFSGGQANHRTQAVARRLGRDVDHATGRVRAVKRGARPADELEAGDVVQPARYGRPLLRSEQHHTHIATIDVG